MISQLFKIESCHRRPSSQTEARPYDPALEGWQCCHGDGGKALRPSPGGVAARWQRCQGDGVRPDDPSPEGCGSAVRETGARPYNPALEGWLPGDSAVKKTGARPDDPAPEGCGSASGRREPFWLLMGVVCVDRLAEG